MQNTDKKYIVRLYDGFDDLWIDITEPVSREEAQRIWNEETKNGTKNVNFYDIDYYEIFPADMKMILSREGLDEWRKMENKIKEEEFQSWIEAGRKAGFEYSIHEKAILWAARKAAWETAEKFMKEKECPNT